MAPDFSRLAEIHLDLLYEHDPARLMLRSRDHSIAIPRVHLVRTASGNRWLLSAALSPQERAAADAALWRQPIVSLDGMEHDSVFTASEMSGFEATYRGPAFVFPDVLPPSSIAVDIIRRGADERTVEELDRL